MKSICLIDSVEKKTRRLVHLMETVSVCPSPFFGFLVVFWSGAGRFSFVSLKRPRRRKGREGRREEFKLLKSGVERYSGEQVLIVGGINLSSAGSSRPF